MESFLVIAISCKEEKEKGWVRLISNNGKSFWKERISGAHYSKSLKSVLVAPGIYNLEIKNTAIGFEALPQYEIVGAELVGTFEELAE